MHVNIVTVSMWILGENDLALSASGPQSAANTLLDSRSCFYVLCIMSLSNNDGHAPGTWYVRYLPNHQTPSLLPLWIALCGEDESSKLSFSADEWQDSRMWTEWV